MNKEQLFEKLNMIKDLEPGWNGNGAGPISPKAIENTKRILNFFSTEPEVFPTACGTIQLELDDPTEKGTSLVIEVMDDQLDCACFIKNDIKHAKEWKINL